MYEPKTRREKEVWEACDDLLAELNDVTKVTGQCIMDKLLYLGYKKGCNNDVYKYRRTWWQSRSIDEREVKGIIKSEKKEELSDPISRAVALVRTEIQEEANQQIESAKIEHEEQLTKLNDKYIAAQEEVQSLECKLAATISELNTVKSTLGQLQDTYATTKQQCELVIAKYGVLKSDYYSYKQDLEQAVKDLKLMHQENIKIAEQRVKELEQNYNADITAIKEAMENQRHKHLMEEENLKAENKRLGEKLEEINIKFNKAEKTIASLAKEKDLQKKNLTYKLRQQILLSEERQRYIENLTRQMNVLLSKYLEKGKIT